MRVPVVLLVLAATWLTVGGCLRLADTDEPFACADDGDCNDGRACFRHERDDDLGRCLESGYCEGDQHCAALEICRQQRCASVECKRDDAEGCGNYRCGTDFACRTRCTHDNHCAGGHICEQEECIPPECDADSAEERCGPYACERGRCHTSCDRRANCRAGLVCIANACREVPVLNGEPCATDDACASGICCPSPEPSETLCAAECVRGEVGSECSWNPACDSGYCADDDLCAPCVEPSCIPDHCGDAECGVFAGIECGACEQ